MGRIIAIGGGELRSGDTFEIDKFIVGAANLDNPNLLFIPTASNDAPSYIESVKIAFGDKLGCDVSALSLIESSLSDEEIRNKILSADIIYVGGGNTKKMMEIWKRKRVDDYLLEAYNQGIILSGLSAGSICWFDSGHSDSDTLENGEIQPYSLVSGIGLIPMLHCPHYNEVDRSEDFSVKVKETGAVGLALDNYAAIELLDDTYRILKSDQYAKAYKVVLDNGNVKIEALEAISEFKPTSKLYCSMSTS